MISRSSTIPYDTPLLSKIPEAHPETLFRQDEIIQKIIFILLKNRSLPDVLNLSLVNTQIHQAIHGNALLPQWILDTACAEYKDTSGFGGWELIKRLSIRNRNIAQGNCQFSAEHYHHSEQRHFADAPKSPYYAHVVTTRATDDVAVIIESYFKTRSDFPNCQATKVMLHPLEPSETASPQEIVIYGLNTRNITATCVNPHGKWICLGDAQGRLFVIDRLEQSCALITPEGTSAPITSIASNDKYVCAFSYQTQKITVYSASLDFLDTLELGNVVAMQIVDSHLCALTNTGAIHLFDLEEKSWWGKVTLSKEDVSLRDPKNPIKLASQGDRLFLEIHLITDTYIHVFDLKEKQHTASWKHRFGCCSARSGGLLFLGNFQTVQVVEATSKRVIQTFPPFDRPITFLHCHKDKLYVFSKGEEKGELFVLSELEFVAKPEVMRLGLGPEAHQPQVPGPKKPKRKALGSGKNCSVQ